MPVSSQITVTINEVKSAQDSMSKRKIALAHSGRKVPAFLHTKGDRSLIPKSSKRNH